MSTSLLSSFKKPPYLDYEGTNPSDNEERVKTSQDVPEDKEDGGEVVEDDLESKDAEDTPVDEEDGGEVVEDDLSCQEAEKTAQEGQEAVHQHLRRGETWY